jgi:hypothetical protein
MTILPLRQLGVAHSRSMTPCHRDFCNLQTESGMHVINADPSFATHAYMRHAPRTVHSEPGPCMRRGVRRLGMSHTCKVEVDSSEPEQHTASAPRTVLHDSMMTPYS